MKPLQLTMRAFGAYAGEQIIDFTLLGDKNFFLIHGPTGSGKTTILDAISFALYGSASGDLRESKNLRSDYAPAEQKTEVEFTFKSGEYIYQVLRAPEQELKKHIFRKYPKLEQDIHFHTLLTFEIYGGFYTYRIQGERFGEKEIRKEIMEISNVLSGAEGLHHFSVQDNSHGCGAEI